MALIPVPFFPKPHDTLGPYVNRRPKLTIATAEEAEEAAAVVAVVAALERFMRETAPPPCCPRPGGPWQEAALHENVARQPEYPLLWA